MHCDLLRFWLHSRAFGSHPQLAACGLRDRDEDAADFIPR
jgi:hypothetical protein